VLLAQNLYAFYNVVTKTVLKNVKYNLFFKFTMLLQCSKQCAFHPSVS